MGSRVGSAGFQPQLAHWAAGRGLPHSEQNLPLFLVPQLHTQTVGASGLGAPQAVQNLPVLPLWPQAHFQPAAGAGAGCAAACRRGGGIQRERRPAQGEY